MSERICIELKDMNSPKRTVGKIYRVPRERCGWRAVRYKNQWYQLFGGFRVDYFIDINFPIRKRGTSGE